MKSAGNNRWKLDRSLIRRGGAELTSPFDGSRVSISWSVNSAPAPRLPISIVECRIAGLGREVHGFGDHLLFSASLTQAYAEAWERFWYLEARARQEPQSRARSSNGFASGATEAEAADSARAELIERSVLLAAWDSRRGWARAQVCGLLNRVRLAAIERFGWKAAFFRLTESVLGEVHCGLATRGRAGGALFDACYRRPHMSGSDVQGKLLRSLLRSAAVFDKRPRTAAPLPPSGGPSSHADFYLDPENMAAFRFLDDGPRQDFRVDLGSYDLVATRTIVNIPGYPVVAMAENPAWPLLSWGKESLKMGGNPWPHPLA